MAMVPRNSIPRKATPSEKTFTVYVYTWASHWTVPSPSNNIVNCERNSGSKIQLSNKACRFKLVSWLHHASDHCYSISEYFFVVEAKSCHAITVGKELNNAYRWITGTLLSTPTTCRVKTIWHCPSKHSKGCTCDKPEVQAGKRPKSFQCMTMVK